MATELTLLTEEEHAQPFSTLIAYFEASIAFGRAERRARSDAKRAAARAERMRAHAIIVDCLRRFERRRAEQPATLELAPSVAV